MEQALDELTDKEKQTLRLIVRGHDAKSMAAELDLSVHTVNERLRVARRKLGVTSSREAARLLFESEGGTYESLRDKDLGDVGHGEKPDLGDVPETRQSGRWANGRGVALVIGGFAMSIFAAILLLGTPLANGGAGSADTDTQARDTAVEAAARDWLALVDARDWKASYAETAASFRNANTLELWSETANQVQGNLGATKSRQFLGVDDVPSPQGIVIVRFRTDYANSPGMTETVSMVSEDGVWKVAGIYVT